MRRAACLSQEQADAIDKAFAPLVNWVENGDAPEDVTASRTNPKPASTKLCAYPEHPYYIVGDEASSNSFECR